MSGRLLIVIASIAVASMAATAQEKPFRSGVELVTIPVTVTNGEGRRVTPLSHSDFRLEEDGVEQEIALFSAEPQPVAIALLVDYSASMRGDRIDAAIAAIRAVGEALTERDRWSISVFADRQQLVLPWAPFDDSFYSRMRRIVPAGGTRLYSAVVSAHQALSAAPLRKRAILLISDGNDVSSQITGDFSADLDTLTYAGSGESTATAALRRGEGLLYAFGMDWPYQAQPRTNARGPSERVDRAALERLAHPTGGFVWMPKSRNELVSAASELMAELREQYTLAYTPRKAADGRYRRIRVTTSNSANKVRHRSGYIAIAPRR